MTTAGFPDCIAAGGVDLNGEYAQPAVACYMKTQQVVCEQDDLEAGGYGVIPHRSIKHKHGYLRRKPFDLYCQPRNTWSRSLKKNEYQLTEVSLTSFV